MVQPRRGRPHPGRRRLVENTVMSALVRTGVVPGSWLLTTTGRRTGRIRRNPVTIIEAQGRRWLVAPYGAVGWVHNARATGRVRLSRGLTHQEHALREVGPEEAGPVLARYVEVAKVTRPWFAAQPGDSLEQFAAEAGNHPTFELLPTPKPHH